MQVFERHLQLRWSDMDPNFHIRHSVYYDFGAMLRMDFLISHGLTPQLMAEHHFGPILFKEEALFKREVRYGDELKMNLLSSALKRDYSRFSMRHEIIKNDVVCATINVDGAWIDTVRRKLTVPPQVGEEVLSAIPKSEDFRWLD